MYYITNRIQAFINDPVNALLELLAVLLAMCIAISFHECAHVYAAYKLGDPTAKNMGRMTLDPTKHLDLVGLLCFVFFGVGYAKPVRVNARNLKHFRRDDVIISIAGPLSNLVLSFLIFGIYFISLQLGVQNDVYALIMSQIIVTNMALAAFNVLPIPPLDGFHVATSLFVRKNYRVVEILQRYGYIILIVLLLTGVINSLLNVVIGGLWSAYNAFFGLFF